MIQSLQVCRSGTRCHPPGTLSVSPASARCIAAQWGLHTGLLRAPRLVMQPCEQCRHTRFCFRKCQVRTVSATFSNKKPLSSSTNLSWSLSFRRLLRTETFELAYIQNAFDQNRPIHIESRRDLLYPPIQTLLLPLLT